MNPPSAGGGLLWVWMGMHFEIIIQYLLKVVGHKNQERVSLGLGSTRVESRHGDSHFWVIQRHEFIHVVCFLI
jgi:hypothetical protein